MDQLARVHLTLCKTRGAPGVALMVGILSLLDGLCEVAKHNLVSNLHLSESMAGALLRREGPWASSSGAFSRWNESRSARRWNRWGSHPEQGLGIC